MINQIQKFSKNAIAIELFESFTAEDARQIEQLFEEKLSQGYEHINILIQVKDLSILKHMDLKGFFQDELWGIKHFNKIGRCAVVSHSRIMESVVKIESKVLHFLNSALEERYFDVAQINEALSFINPDD